MKAVRPPLLALMALVLSAAAPLARAQGAPATARTAAPQTSPQREVSMDQAVRLAQRRFRARVVRAETETQGDRTIYVLRMLDGAGRVFAVRVDAASGAIL
ncbi:MAG TPA: PepSY domain-containing protein [Steroidobacteraceae bacterium]